MAVVLTAFNFVSANSFADTVKYNIESNHAFVLWTANHVGFSNQMGKFSGVVGTINFDEKNPAKSSVEATIQISSLVTGLEKFDNHLKSKDFFDVEQFPTAKFVSKKIKVTGKNTAKIEGDLTLHGVTKTVVLNAKFNKAAENPFNKTQTIGFSADTEILRSDFGINYAIPAVSDKVQLKIEVEANK